MLTETGAAEGRVSTACRLLILVAVAMACARIASVELVYEPGQPRRWPAERPRPMPTFSSNDRARWATVRALVDEGTFVVGQRNIRVVRGSWVAPLGQLNPIAVATLTLAGKHERLAPRSNTGIIFEDGYQSVDKALDPKTLEYHSTKPPLLSVLIAGLYWLVQTLTGWTLAAHPFAVVRTILLLVNALPFGVSLWLLARLAGRYGATEGVRLFVVAAAAFGTMVTPFLITLNNHTIATFSVMFAWYAVLRCWRRAARAGTPPAWRDLIAAGFFSAFAACNEMPALAFTAALFGVLVWYWPRRTLVAFLPAALVPALAFFGANLADVGQWRPIQSNFGSAWYTYEGSHWRPPAPGEVKTGIDWAHLRETRAEYALHLLVGHHGLFSLEPIWLFALGAMIAAVARCRLLWERFRLGPTQPLRLPWFVLPVGLLLTVVVVGFYLVQSNNYGGWTNGPRWLMWLTPIWLTCLLPAADRLCASRLGRGALGVALALSIFSAHYQLWNPWRHPWLYDLLAALGWPTYERGP